LSILKALKKSTYKIKPASILTATAPFPGIQIFHSH